MSSGAHKRRKGVTGEREVTKAFEQIGGARLYQLEKGGDTLIELRDFFFHVESKRQERLEIMRWIRQAEGECGEHYIPLVCFRQNGEPWRVVLQLEHFLDVATG